MPAFEFLEVEAVGRGFCLGAACGKRGGAEQGSRGSDAERAAHNVAPAVALDDDIADGFPRIRAAGNIVMGLGCRGPVAENVVFRHMQRYPCTEDRSKLERCHDRF